MFIIADFTLSIPFYFLKNSVIISPQYSECSGQNLSHLPKQWQDMMLSGLTWFLFGQAKLKPPDFKNDPDVVCDRDGEPNRDPDVVCDCWPNRDPTVCD